MIVTRPDSFADVAWSRARYQVEVETLLAEIGERPNRLLGLAGSAVAWAGTVALQDSDDPDLDAALQLANDAASAHFVRVSAGSPTTLRIGRRAIHIVAGRPGAETTLAWWQVAWSLAVILSDPRASAILARTPAAVFGAIDEPDRAWLSAMKAMLGEVEDDSTAIRIGRIETAIRATRDPARLPRLAALRGLLDRDAKAVNGGLVQVLQLHKRQHGGSADADDPRAILALDAIAIAALGARAGLRVDVRSDYLPLRLWRPDRDPADLDWWLCPDCGAAVGSRASDCTVCGHDLTTRAARRVPAAAWPLLPREACEMCREPLIAWALRCPRCRAERVRAEPPVPGRRVGPARRPRAATVLLHGTELRRRDIPARLVQAGFLVQRIAPATLRRAPLATWEVQLDVQEPGAEARSYRLWTGADGLYLAGHLGRSPLSGWWTMVRVAAALVPNGAAFDDDARSPISADTLASWASALSPPPAGSLFTVHTRYDRAHRRAWLYTRGLGRVLGFDLEILDVPAMHAERYGALMRAAAFRLAEHGDALPPEGDPFVLGDGIRLSWRPSAWSRADQPDGFGASGEDRIGIAGPFATLVAADGDDRPQPAATLAVPLIRGVQLWESRWEIERRRAEAHARIDRFAVWRRRRGHWRFRVRCRVPGPDDAPVLPSTWRVLSPKDLLPPDILDWRIEHADGVMDPFDVDPVPSDVGAWDEVTPINR